MDFKWDADFWLHDACYCKYVDTANVLVFLSDSYRMRARSINEEKNIQNKQNLLFVNIWTDDECKYLCSIKLLIHFDISFKLNYIWIAFNVIYVENFWIHLLFKIRELGFFLPLTRKEKKEHSKVMSTVCEEFWLMFLLFIQRTPKIFYKNSKTVNFFVEDPSDAALNDISRIQFWRPIWND